MSNPFFLTRQTANLMEDFVRELKAGASLFLLYGESGVGKTRFLEELTHTRLADSKIHWIDLKAGGSGDGSLVDSSAMVEDIFTGAQPGDIVIADHFEMALQKTRHQLFLSWSTDGVDKQINLIVSSNDRFFEEMRQLANQYQVRVQSFQLMALNPEEAAAFLGFYLFPKRPIGKLSIPPLLQEQLALTQGAVGKIVEIAERAGDQITTAPMDDVETSRKDSKNMVGILIGVALVIGGGWYYLNSRSQTEDVPVAANQTQAPLAATDSGEAVVEDESPASQATAQPGVDGAEPVGAVVREIADEADASPEEASLESAVVEAQVAVEVPATDETQIAVEVPANNETQIAVEVPENNEAQVAVEVPASNETAVAVEAPSVDTDEMMSEAGTASDEEAVLVDESNPPLTEAPEAVEAEEVPVESNSGETVALAPEAVPLPPPAASRFDADLQTSLDWINRSDKKTGTIQIMMLSHDKFDERVYYDYIDYLATRGVDIAALKTFMTYTGGRKVYSVVYGEYQSWKAAGDAIAGLPSVLRDTAPIPRSAGSLLKEIRRLEAEN